MKEERNFSSISPSAKSLLLLKAFTDIPFAKTLAELAYYPRTLAELTKNADFAFWARVLHFEKRYKSIDQLLKGTGATNILELASGYSMRGLNTAMTEQVYYIDTDLPALIEEKKALVDKLKEEHPVLRGTLELTGLNAMNMNELQEICNSFPEGPIAIVNEGLLMYLNRQEKEQLCRNIREVLKQRGGHWITADVYIRKAGEKPLPLPELTKTFFEQHHIEENKFESFEEAEAFFTEMGFVKEKEAHIGSQTLSSFNNLTRSFKNEPATSGMSPAKTQATWMLRLADSATQ